MLSKMNHPKDKFDTVRRNPYSITYVYVCTYVRITLNTYNLPMLVPKYLIDMDTNPLGMYQIYINVCVQYINYV